MCRSRRELSNAYFLAKFGFDTAENEPCQVSCPEIIFGCCQTTGIEACTSKGGGTLLHFEMFPSGTTNNRQDFRDGQEWRGDWGIGEGLAASAARRASDWRSRHSFCTSEDGSSNLDDSRRGSFAGLTEHPFSSVSSFAFRLLFLRNSSAVLEHF